MKRLLRLLGLGCGAYLIYATAFPFFEQRYPGLCSIARWLPKEAVATKCERSGLGDHVIVFEATGSREAYEGYFSNMSQELQTAKHTRQHESAEAISDQLDASEDHVRVSSTWRDGLIHVVFAID